MSVCESLETRLFRASIEGDLEAFRSLVEEMKDLNIDINGIHSCNQKIPLLSVVIKYYNEQTPEIIKLLVQSGCNINACSNFNDTALMYLARHENRRAFTMLKYLVEHGADVNARNNAGLSPLWYVYYNGNPKRTQIVEYLVGKGADINAKNSKGDTILISLAKKAPRRKSLYPFVKKLVECGADVHIRSRSSFFGSTALMIAMRNHDWEFIKELTEIPHLSLRDFIPYRCIEDQPDWDYIRTARKIVQRINERIENNDVNMAIETAKCIKEIMTRIDKKEVWLDKPSIELMEFLLPALSRVDLVSTACVASSDFECGL